MSYDIYVYITLFTFKPIYTEADPLLKNIKNTLFLYIIPSPQVCFAPPRNLIWLRACTEAIFLS